MCITFRFFSLGDSTKGGACSDAEPTAVGSTIGSAGVLADTFARSAA
jgi:hypothetical protein